MTATEQKALEVKEFLLAKKVEKIRRQEQIRTAERISVRIFIVLIIVGLSAMIFFDKINSDFLTIICICGFVLFERGTSAKIENLESRIDALEKEIQKKRGE